MGLSEIDWMYVCVGIFTALVAGVVLLILEYRTGVFAKVIPGTDRLLEEAEARPDLYKYVVRIWNYVPARLKTSILRRANPKVALGAVAVIIDPYSQVDDPRVLLGKHAYHERDGTPWALLAGAVKKRDREVSDPAQTAMREVKEETGLDIEVVKLLGIDTDWGAGTMDFYFECALCKGPPDLKTSLLSPEVEKLEWHHISKLPDNMSHQHRKWLTDVLTGLPGLPGVSWTAHQEPPDWWDRFHSVQHMRRLLMRSTGEPLDTLGALVRGAKDVLSCEVVSVFVAEPPVAVVSPDLGLPSDAPGSLRLVLESSEVRGSRMEPPHVVLPLSQPEGEKLGLTVWLVVGAPLGRAVRLHAKWLTEHPHVKSWCGHDHLTDRECHSLAGVSVLGQNEVLGLLKAENKTRYNPEKDKDEFVPFEPDDGYIIEELALAAGPLLQKLSAPE